MIEFGTPKQPLLAYANESAFKLFMFDVGLLGTLSDLPVESILSYDYGSYKGYFAENFVCQALTCMDNKPLYNWQEKTAEVDFLKSFGNDIIPIEVKAGTSTHAKSLKVYNEKYHPATRVILSAKLKPSSKEQSLYHFPLYLAGQLNRILQN